MFAFMVTCLAALAAASPVRRDDACKTNWNGTSITGALEGGACRYTVRYGNAERWEYPTAATNQTGVDASKFPPQCAQTPDRMLEGANGTEQPAVEDCLYMTVYTPQNGGKDLPVFYWIHGGSYIGGSASDRGLNGSALASSENMIVVFTQYRLGVLGWLPPKEAPTAGDPNYALRDVLTSLNVVKDNIASVGGDPKAVTVGGQSAGASMTRALWAAPMSRGLFRGMVMHSDPINFGTQAPDETAGLQGLVYNTTTANCSDFDCWKGVELNKLLNTSDFVTSVSEGPKKVKGVTIGEVYRPSYGTETLPQDPTNALFYNTSNLAFDIASMPLLISTTHNESGYLVERSLKQPTPGSAVLLNISLNSFVMNQTQTDYILNSGAYPIANTSDSGRSTLEVAITDGVWRCASRAVASRWAEAGGKVWLAEWTRGQHYTFDDGNYCRSDGVVCHGDDVYPTFESDPEPQPEDAWAADVRKHWAAFIKTGDPQLTQWTANSDVSDVNNLGNGPPIKDCPADLWGTKVPWYWQAYSNDSISTLGHGTQLPGEGAAANASQSGAVASPSKASGAKGLAVGGSALVAGFVLAISVL